MLDRIWKVHSRSDRHGVESRTGSKHSRRQPLVEFLEGRQLLAASLAPITSFSVPAQLGYQLPLNGSGTTDPSQTFTATSSNPNIKVSVAQGQFWTVTVSHMPAPNTSDITIDNESMTFQLFGDLTPITAARIATLTSENYYTTATLPNSNPAGPGKYIPRITSVSSSGFSAIQGGSGSPTSTSSFSGLPPIATEPVQQLAFTGSNQLAMANTGQPDSTDAQFFITNGTVSQSVQQTFDFNYTLVGQLVSGQQTVTNLSQVAVQDNTPPPGGTAELSQPITPVVINSATLSSTNPNGVLHIDTTSAAAGQTATITVTAHDPTGNTTMTQSFTVTVSAYNGPSNPVINFVPFASPVSAATTVNTPVTVQLAGKSGYPDATNPGTLTYKLTSQPTKGTISQFNATTGTLVYTPNKNYTGPDTFQYTVLGSGPQSAPNNIPSQPGTVTMTVGAANTGAVHLITNSRLPASDVLIVTPLPRTDHGTDSIVISQQVDSTVPGGQKIVVTVNGIPDLTQPAANLLQQIIVYGGKASTDINVLPGVSTTIPITLDGGHGGHNVIQAGGGPTREHGWFGHTLLIGGTGPDTMIGRKGFVRFKPTASTKVIYAGNINPRWKHRTVTPTGTFYRYVDGRLVPVLTT